MDTPEEWCIPDPSLVPPVPGQTAQERGLNYSSLCSLGWHRLTITGLCRSLLIQHFSTPLNIESPDLRSFVWTPDQRTGILIEVIHKWVDGLTEKRPAIIIKPNSRRNLRLGIGNRHAGIDSRGMQSYSTFWVGSTTLFCLHGTGAGADILATEVEEELTGFGPELIRDLGLMSFSVTEVGAIAEIEESKTGYVVPVTVGWAYERSWTINQETPKLKKIQLSTLLHGAIVNQTR